MFVRSLIFILFLAKGEANGALEIRTHIGKVLDNVIYTALRYYSSSFFMRKHLLVADVAAQPTAWRLFASQRRGSPQSEK